VKAFDRIPDAPYETVRKKDIRFGVLPSVEVPARDEVYVTVAEFVPEIRGILFYGPVLIQHSAAEIEVIAGHEWAHAYLWCRSQPWTDEHLVDQTAAAWGFDMRLLEDMRFKSTGNCLRRFLSV
jgi:hypothetical protein